MNNQSILSIREKIKEFIVSQNILSMIASVTIAVAAGTVIKSFVTDILFPIIDFVFKNKNNYNNCNRIFFLKRCSLLNKNNLNLRFSKLVIFSLRVILEDNFNSGKNTMN